MDKTVPAFNQTIMEEAAAWLLRIEEAPETLTSEVFERWLHADPRHLRMFNHMANEWGRAGDIYADANIAPLEPVKPHSSRRHRSYVKRRGASLIGGAGALLAAAAALVIFLQTAPATAPASIEYATRTGEIATYDLPDGSKLTLDAQSRATVVLDEEDRFVALETGRVFVDVAPDPDRPFRVGGGEVSFAALGTSYAVERDADSWRLDVYEGTVQLKAPSITKDYGAGKGAHLKAGDIVNYDFATSLDASRPNWTSGRVVFDGTPLKEALQAFERYSDSHVNIVGEDLQTYEVSGVFRLTDIDAFLESLEIMTGASLSAGPGSDLRLEPSGAKAGAGAMDKD